MGLMGKQVGNMGARRRRWLVYGQVLWLLLAIIAVVGFRMSLLAWRPAILLIAVAAGGVALTGFSSLVVLFFALRRGRREVFASCLLSTALSLPVIIGMLWFGVQAAKVPPLHDITTDPENPPVFQAAGSLRAPTDNSLVYQGAMVAAQQRQAYPDLAPLQLPMAPAEAFARTLATAHQLNWQIVGQDPVQGRIEAVDQTMLFGFRDDIVIRILPTPGGSRIDVRSASRVGVSDLGVNAKRIRSFVAAFSSPKPN